MDTFTKERERGASSKATSAPRLIGGILEIPNASDIRELVGSLAFRTEGTGLGFSYGDVMGMTLGEALEWNRYQARRYQEINDAHNKAGR